MGASSGRPAATWRPVAPGISTSRNAMSGRWLAMHSRTPAASPRSWTSKCQAPRVFRSRQLPRRADRRVHHRLQRLRDASVRRERDRLRAEAVLRRTIQGSARTREASGTGTAPWRAGHPGRDAVGRAPHESEAARGPTRRISPANRVQGRRPVGRRQDAEIVWIEAEDYYVLVHSKQGRHMVRASLASLEQRLDPRPSSACTAPPS